MVHALLSGRRWARICSGLLRLCLLAGFLAACQLPGPDQTPLPDRVQVFEGAVTIRAPENYCYDASASKESGQEWALVFAACRALGDQSRRAPDTRAILIATVANQPLPPAARAELQLEAFFQSAAGRALLSPSGHPSDIETVTFFPQRNGVFWLKARLRAPVSTMPGMDIWHAVAEIKNHSVHLSVYPASDTAGGRDLMLRFIDLTTAAN